MPEGGKSQSEYEGISFMLRRRKEAMEIRPRGVDIGRWASSIALAWALALCEYDSVPHDQAL
jgi:hypothetical protein